MELALSPTRPGLPLRELLHLMALAREGDRREGILLRQGKGWFQVPGMGHEALAAIAYCLTPNDDLFPTTAIARSSSRAGCHELRPGAGLLR